MSQIAKKGENLSPQHWQMLFSGSGDDVNSYITEPFGNESGKHKIEVPEIVLQSTIRKMMNMLGIPA